MNIPKNDPVEVAFNSGWDDGVADVSNGLIEDINTLPIPLTHSSTASSAGAYKTGYTLATEGYRD